MTNDCEVIRDLMPLYTDGACSPASRALVEKHLQTCPGCRDLMNALGDSRIEEDLQAETHAVITREATRFKRRSAAAGGVIAGIFMVPILVCLIVNIATGASLGWFFIVLASLMTAASLTVVPLLAARNRLMWTFAAFTGSLVVLLAVICLATGGRWFFIASGAALFGLAAVFLPFVFRAAPVKRLIGGASKTGIILAVDTALFIHMMNAISFSGGFRFRNLILLLGTLAGLTLAALMILNRGGQKHEQE